MLDSKQIAKSPERSPSTAMRNQERSRLTRQSLLDAARQVFARDGFEKASLQDISTIAGKTRGAFYAHFADKEDIFFAVIEQLLASSRERFRQQLKHASTRAKGIAALTAHLVDVIEDKERALLALEFKMYVLRHPHEQKRLTALHAAVCLRGLIDIGELLPEISTAIGSIESRRQVAQLGAIVDGLSLNRLFDPESLDSAVLLKQAAAGIHALL